ncbi:MAG: hypothetical protein JWN75_110 [Candidatus Saccharibacteria bacterium]|nr:hypothetical protein [Candidatus Saccharibacteria bacterium]
MPFKEPRIAIDMEALYGGDFPLESVSVDIWSEGSWATPTFTPITTALNLSHLPISDDSTMAKFDGHDYWDARS